MLGCESCHRARDLIASQFDNAPATKSSAERSGALRKIHHPKVVEVFWAGKTTAGDWYLITEYIDGETLEEFATGKAPPARPGRHRRQ